MGTATTIGMNNNWSTTSYDNGSCCGLRTTIQAYLYDIAGGAKTAAGSAGTNATYSSANKALNSYACVAFSNLRSGTAETKIEDPIFESGTATGANKSWWCSNGLYNMRPAASDSNQNVKQTIPDTANQRMELAMVGCPQLKANCSANVYIKVDDAASSTMKTEVKVATMTTEDKCTWVAYGLLNPPAFTINKTTVSSKSAGLNVASGWTIHHMEYNSEQLPIGAAANYWIGPTQANYATGMGGGEAVDFTSKVPRFTMSFVQYNKQRTWYGKGSGTVLNQSNWSSPYQNMATAASATTMKGQQNYGSVAAYLTSASTDYDAGSTSTAAKFDQRQVRYFPLQVAVNDNAMGKAVATAYGTAKTSYDSAKTTWNNYVAILTKNAKVDAFSAAFAPPKAPTVPPLPNMPWLPDVSATL
jgi:hypothetical protein